MKCLRAMHMIALLLMASLCGCMRGGAEEAVKMIVASPPGGASDIVARLLTERLAAILRKPFIVENLPGSSGLRAGLGTMHGAADGSVVCLCTLSQLTAFPASDAANNAPLRLDPLTLTPIGLAFGTKFVLVVRGEIPASTLDDFVAYTQAHPEKVTFAYANATGMISAYVFREEVHSNFEIIPYRGNADGEGRALLDLMAGRVNAMFVTLALARPYIQNGSLRVLASLGEERDVEFPEVPTLVERGMTGFAGVKNLGGLVGPPDIPAPIVTRLNEALGKALQDQKLAGALHDNGLSVRFSSPQELGSILGEQFSEMTQILRKTGLRF